MPIKIGDKTYKPHQISKICVGSDLYYQSTLPKREISYYGTAANITSPAKFNMGISFKNFALFGGGCGSSWSATKNTVDAYDDTLTKTQLANLITARRSHGGEATKDYAIFMGGNAGSGKTTAVDAYDSTLTKVSNVTQLSYGRFDGASVRIKDEYVLFVGGDGGNKKVECYDNNLTKTGLTDLPQNTWQFGDIGTNIGNYGIVCGGITSAKTAKGYTWDANLTRTDYNNFLTQAKAAFMSASTDTYALFGGGVPASGNSNSVDAYDSNLTKTVCTTLSSARAYGTAAGLRDFVLFAGGNNSSSKVVDIYDNDLVRTTGTQLTYGREVPSSAVAGNYLLFAGGEGSGYPAAVEVYEAS